MLSERLVASIGPREQTTSTSVFPKDAAIFIHDVHNASASQNNPVFKKSATPPNCLAVSASHIYAAQADKAVINVYNRAKGNQEATVPFPERIGCIALACDGAVLVIGTEQGRLFLWETYSGRLVTTSQAHLQQVTALAVDQSSNLVLSGSADSSIHVWSLPDLLSFSSGTHTSRRSANAPLHTLSAHKGAITSLQLGHSSSFANIVISASRDNTCIVWDYQGRKILRSILLSDTPLCLAIDPAERAFYAGYGDGSVQSIDFYSDTLASANLQQMNAASQVTAPIQPSPRTRWQAPSGTQLRDSLCMSVSFDGSQLISGHSSGHVAIWDIPRARFSRLFAASPHPGPATNLVPLPVTGFLNPVSARVAHHTVNKPRHADFESSDMSEGRVPGNYQITCQLTSELAYPAISSAERINLDTATDYERALAHSSFPPDLLAESIADLEAWTDASNGTSGHKDHDADFMALDAPSSEKETVETENKKLKDDLSVLRRVQKAAFEQMQGLRKENAALEKQIKKGNEQDLEAERRFLEEAERSWG